MTFDERLEFLFRSTESLHASTQDLHATVQEHTRQILEHTTQLETDGKHIRQIAEAVQGLVRIADAHEQRISDFEGEQ